MSWRWVLNSDLKVLATLPYITVYACVLLCNVLIYSDTPCYVFQEFIVLPGDIQLHFLLYVNRALKAWFDQICIRISWQLQESGLKWGILSNSVQPKGTFWYFPIKVLKLKKKKDVRGLMKIYLISLNFDTVKRGGWDAWTSVSWEENEPRTFCLHKAVFGTHLEGSAQGKLFREQDLN